MKQRTRILIYILVAIAVIIIGSIAIINNRADKPLSAQDHIDLGHKYLIELSYDKAVIEFTEAIEIEPLNADAYLGLAEAYAGTGDTEKAIEILEEGYDITGDERLKDMLEELLPPESEVTTAVTTLATSTTEATTEATTVSTAVMAIVPDLSGLTEEEAIAACEAAGLKYSVSYDYSDDVEKGYVIGQTIPVNASVEDGVSVPFTVSEGVKIVTTVTTEDFIIIKGIQYSTDLIKLDLSGLELNNEDIKDLDKMINLKYLYLGNKVKWGNNISDITSISKLTNLEYLSLCDNPISNIDALSELTNIKSLCLYHTKVSNINCIENLINIEKLDCGGTNISDISVLKKMTKLVELNLIGNNISDISPIENLINLKSLALSRNKVTDICSLKKLTNLNTLMLDGNVIIDISVLSYLKNLNSLWLDGSLISDISPIKDLSNLTQLVFDNSAITENAISDLKNTFPNCEIYNWT